LIMVNSNIKSKKEEWSKEKTKSNWNKRIKNKTGYGRTWLPSKNQKRSKIFKRGKSSEI